MMKIEARLGVDVVAVDQDEELSVLLGLQAPQAAGAARPAHTVLIVLDRSGSMAGPRLAGAQQAICSLVDRLRADDRFGLVTFDDEAAVVVPAGPVADRRAIQAAVQGVRPGGMTDLSAGYLRGLQEARRVAAGTGASVLLVSDGHANVGITAPDTIAGLAHAAAGDRITSSTLGYGLDYDESLLAALAKGGQGNHHFAQDPDTAAGLIATEVSGLLEQTVQAASVLVSMSPAVAGVEVENDLQHTMTSDGLLIELGSLGSGETRRLLLTFSIPRVQALGLALVATLVVRYVDLASMTEETVTLPLHVNVVPADLAAGRVSDAAVTSERLYQRAQAAKRDAAAAYRSGDAAAAAAILQPLPGMLRAAAVAAPAPMVADLTQEAADVENLMDGGRRDVRWASKQAVSDASRKSRTRGRG